MKVFLTVRGHYKKKHLFVTKFYIGYVQEACNLSSEITFFFSRDCKFFLVNGVQHTKKVNSYTKNITK